MSYSRFGPEDNVYVFMEVNGWLECCWCSLLPNVRSFQAWSTAEMVDHLRQHKAAGHKVGDDVIPALLADDAENFPMASP